jgi:hypothetical protein
MTHRFHSLRVGDETDTPISVQRELLRHSTIAMTMDGYGRGVPSANRAANAKVVAMLLKRTVNGLPEAVTN